jgi:hypothetical protein
MGQEVIISQICITNALDGDDKIILEAFVQLLPLFTITSRSGFSQS